MDLASLFGNSKTQDVDHKAVKETVTTSTESTGSDHVVESHIQRNYHASKMYDDASSLKPGTEFIDNLNDEDNIQKPDHGEDFPHSSEQVFQGGSNDEVFGGKSMLPRRPCAENPLQYNNCYGDFNSDSHLVSFGTAEKHFPCTFCGKIFTNIASFTRHVRSHEAELPFRCNICQKAFSEKQMLDVHLQVHLSGELFKCELCEKSFAEKCHLNEHLKSHTGDEKLHCSFCTQIFSRKDALIKHLESHTGEKPFQCGICGESFTLKSSLNHHLITHSGEKKVHQGEQNDEVFKQKSQLFGQLDIQIAKPYRCDACGKAFKQNAHLKKHLKSYCERLKSLHKPASVTKCDGAQSGGTPFHCSSSSDARFKGSFPLQYHFESEKISSDESSDNEQYPTYRRGSTISSTSLEHLETVGKDSFDLNNSDMFHVKTSIAEPESVILGGAPVCHSVSNAFSGESSLIEHLQSYNEVKPFQCTICKQSFSEKSHVVSHLKSHSSNEVYRCSICDQEFNSQKNLSQHMQLHTGENPFRCQYCDRAFRQKSRLNKHLRIHTGEKPFQCHMCDKAFRLRRALDAHIRSHTGQKPFYCNVCEKGFSYQASYNKHLTFHDKTSMF